MNEMQKLHDIDEYKKQRSRDADGNLVAVR